MRTLILAGLTMVTALAATAADAQRIAPPGAPYPMPGQQIGAPMPGHPGMDPSRGPMPGYPGGPNMGPRQGGGSRWGSSVGGHWSGGVYAPGGWNAYRRPSRGWRVPEYWTSPDFFVGDYAAYGLWAPPAGYSWHRYYDDAVLIDARGKVWDSRGGIDWDGAGYGYDDHYAQGGAPYPLPAPMQHGAVTTYSTSGGGYASGYSSGGYYYPGATTTVVTIQSAPTVTTTTTEYVETVRTRYVAPRRVYHAPKKVWHPARCTCRKVVRVIERPIQGS